MDSENTYTFDHFEQMPTRQLFRVIRAAVANQFSSGCEQINNTASDLRQTLLGVAQQILSGITPADELSMEAKIDPANRIKWRRRRPYAPVIG